MTTSTTSGVQRFVLDNGLTVLIKPAHSAPVVALLAHVNVGYFDEPDRWNGLAHVVEHMFFKGTEKRPGKEQIAEDVRALGANINAGTYYEETSYYITAPSANFEKALEIQADAFIGSLFDGEELAKELEVIIQESKQKRDNPGAMVLESMYARAFDRHRIRRWRIGPDEVLRALRHEDLAEFVGQTYRPGNIVLTIVGDVEVERALAAARRYWGALPGGPSVKDAGPAEPERAEFRYARMRGEIRQRLVEVGFHAPDILHPDAAPLVVLGNLLADGRSARLYRALKEEKRLANSVWAGYEGFSQMGIFTMGAETVADDPLAAERALFEEIARVVRDPIDEAELARIKTRMRTRRIFAQEEVLGMARTLAEYQALGDFRLADEVPARLDSVTADDIKRVAAQYVNPGRATIMEYLPASAEAPERSAEDVERVITEGWPTAPVTAVSAARDEAAAPRERALPSGATLLYKRRRDLPVVAVQVLFPGGRHEESPAVSGVTSLMMKSSLKGTESYSAAEISERIESLGSSIGTANTSDYLGYSLKLPADRIRDGLAVLGEVIGKPTFPEEEVQKEKQTILGEIRRFQDSMPYYAYDQFYRACYGEQPYGLPVVALPEAVERLTREHVREWHERWLRADQAIWAVVGDIEEAEIADLLAGIVPARAAAPRETRAQTYMPPGEQVVSVAKQQTASVMGFPGPSMQDDERHALDVLSEIASGLAGRFFQAVRGDNGLAYAVHGVNRPRKDAGNFTTYAATSPANEELAREILLAEIDKLAREPVTDKELADAKEAIRGEHVIGTQTFGAQAGEMAALRLYGRPLDGAERYLSRIAAVTAEEIRAASERYLRRDRMWLGVVRGEGA